MILQNYSAFSYVWHGNILGQNVLIISKYIMKYLGVKNDDV